MLMMALFGIALRVLYHRFAGIPLTLIIIFVPGSISLCFPPSPQWPWADLGSLESQQALTLLLCRHLNGHGRQSYFILLAFSLYSL
jgi:hypothetical protein